MPDFELTAMSFDAQIRQASKLFLTKSSCSITPALLPENFDLSHRSQVKFKALRLVDSDPDIPR